MTGTTQAPVRTQLRVLEPGMLSLVQDSGRRGWAHLGVSPSGAADSRAMALANRMVGNDEAAAVVEVTNGGLVFDCAAACIAAVTGAPLAIGVGARKRWTNEVFPIPAGAKVSMGIPVRGLRSYLAVRGGILSDPDLGSCSSDRLSGLGPPPLAPGTTLGIGIPDLSFPNLGPVVGEPLPGFDAEVTLPVRFGPRSDWFEDEAHRLLVESRFEVTGDSDRVGVRLAGPLLPRRITAELTSEGVVQGSLQAPPGGRLTMFGPDHPVTGGYPVIAVVRCEAFPLMAQLRPGQGVRFVRD